MAADKRAARLGVLALVATLLFGAMGTRLWFLQTVQADSLQEVVDARKTKTVRLLPERGRIFDNDGRILADNQPVLSVAVDWEVINRQTDRAALFNRLSGWVNVPVEEMEARYDGNRYSRYKPLPIADDIDENVAIAIRERSEDFPGVSIERGWKRVYPYAPLASHVVGYMGAITAEDEAHYEGLGYDTSLGGENVGRAGVELSYEEQLHGKWGEVTYEVDAANRIVREISRSEPVNGMDVQLSIDLDLQQYTERLLQTQLRAMRRQCARNPEVTKPDGVTKGPLDPSLAVGTCVNYKAPAGSTTVMNYQTGQIMAMASYPTFDNRWFSVGVDSAKFEEIFPTKGPDGVSKPDPDRAALANRAIQGQYNMGSTFKVFTAYAALATGRLSPGTTYNDEGTYTLQSITQRDKCATGAIRCVFRNSWCDVFNGPCKYGVINVMQSLAVSSDAFYYKLGEDFYNTPGTQLQDQVSLFSFGADTGIDLPFEFDGRVPTNEIKRQLIESGALRSDEADTLQQGDLLQLAIGQGLLAATPMQLAVGYSAFANGGWVVVPQVVQRILEPETPDGEPGFADLTQAVVAVQVAPASSRQIPMTPELRGPIQDGIRRNITGPGYNGRSTTAEELFRDYPADAIQVAGKTGTAQGRLSYPWNDSSAFAAYSLDPNHPYTVVSYLEKSGFGSTGAAPVVKCMFLALSNNPRVVLDPVQVSETLDTSQTVAAKDLPDVDTGCMARAATPARPPD